jgi:hypothetical protein
VSKFSVNLINLKEFEKWIRKLGDGRVERVIDAYLNEQCAIMVQEMKAQLGVYQPARGDFPAWAPLKPSTLAGKRADTPLFEDGELAASCDFFSIGPTNKMIGASKLGANWHEYGLPFRTPPLPARPFVRPIVWLHIDDMKKGIRKALVSELKNGSSFATR